MTRNEIKDMTELDEMLDRAASQDMDVPPDLMSRVLLDADALQPRPQLQGATKRLSVWQRVSEAFGGWPAMGGLVAATCAGFWIGFSDVTDLETGRLLLLGDQDAWLSEEAAEISGFGWDLEEEL